MDHSNKRKSSSCYPKKTISDSSCKRITAKTAEVDLQLNGKLISLSKRPGGLSARSSQISGSEKRRPVSAIASGNLHSKANLGSVTGWKRPQSADHSLPNSKYSPALATTEDRNYYFPQVNSDWNELDRSNLFSLKKPLSLSSLTDESDHSYHVTTPRIKSGNSNFNSSLRLNLTGQKIDCSDYYSDFGATYTLPDMLERTWTEEELIRYCDEADNFESDENLQSESSMGEKILAMVSEQKQEQSPRHMSDNADLARSAECLLGSRLELAERETDLLLKQLVARERGCNIIDKNPLNMDLKQSLSNKQLYDELRRSASELNVGHYTSNGLNEYVIRSERKDALQRLSVGSNSSDLVQMQMETHNHSLNKYNDVLGIDQNEPISDNCSLSPISPVESPAGVTPRDKETLAKRQPTLAQRTARKLSARSRSVERNNARNYEPPVTSRSLSLELERKSNNYSLQIAGQTKYCTTIPVSLQKSNSRFNDVSPMSSDCFQNIPPSTKDNSLICKNNLINETVDEDRFSRITSFNKRAGESLERSRMLAAKFSVEGNCSNTDMLRDNELLKKHTKSSNSEGMHQQNKNILEFQDAGENSDEVIESENLAFSPCSKMLMLIDFNEQIAEPLPPVKQRIPTYEEIIDVSLSGDDMQTTKDTQYRNTINLFLKEAGQETDRSVESHCLKDLESRHTSNDINDILKVLEQEEAAEYSSRITDSVSDLNLANQFRDTYCHQNNDAAKAPSAENPGNLVELLSYLDKVDESSKAVLDLAKDSIKSVQENTARQLGLTEPFGGGDGENQLSVKLEDLLSLSVVDLAHMVFTLRFQMTDKAKSVRALKQALKEEREERQRIEYEAEKNLKSRLQEQKDHFENAVSRHQKFIDQLISDKKALTSKVENVVDEMKALEERHAKNVKVIQERHAIEVKRAKDCQAASNKMKMDSWISTKTKKIKEQTVKGLEPELVRMTAAHQQELSELRHLHQHELKEADLRGARKTETALELLRTQMALEKEAAIARERDLAKTRLEKQAEQEEQSYQEQRQRLLAEGQREKQRFEQELRAAAADNARLVERLAQEHRDAVDAAARSHAVDIRKMRDALNVEREQLVAELRRQKDLELAERERQCREESRIERDKQIEMVITRLTDETSQAKSEMEMAANTKMRKLKEKFAADVKELEDAEHAAKVKYSKVKEQLADSEDAVLELKACNRQLEKELHEEKKLSAAFSAERAQLKESVRDEVAAQLAAAERETVRLRAEVEGSRARFDVELRTLRDVQQHELRAVHERVKAVVVQRDATVHELRNRCSQLEALVEAQRKEYLLK